MWLLGRGIVGTQYRTKIRFAEAGDMTEVTKPV
jgi:hypothetical protein